MLLHSSWKVRGASFLSVCLDGLVRFHETRQFVFGLTKVLRPADPLTTTLRNVVDFFR